MRKLLTLGSAFLLASLPAILVTSCNQSARPAPASQEAAAVDAPAAPDESPGQAAQAANEAAPTSEQDPSEPEPAPGDVALPPGSASAWNTGQSDGQPGKADRGINDYRAIIQGNRDQFRKCYEESLGKHPGIKGRVTLAFVLDPKGNVKEAHLDQAASDIHEKDLEECLVKTLKTLSFPPSRRGMESTVRYPFQFNPRGG